MQELLNKFSKEQIAMHILFACDEGIPGSSFFAPVGLVILSTLFTPYHQNSNTKHEVLVMAEN